DCVERNGDDRARAARGDRHHAGHRRGELAGGGAVRSGGGGGGRGGRPDRRGGRHATGALGWPDGISGSGPGAAPACARDGAGGCGGGLGGSGAAVASRPGDGARGYSARWRVKMFLRFVIAAVRFRRRRLVLAFSAVAVAATLATALFSVYSDIERKMRVEFR